MIVYVPGEAVPREHLVSLGRPDALGGRVISGDPEISARVDFAGGDVTAGVFQATAGTIEVSFPFTEHATILSGSVVITDGSGASHRYEPGDSYVIAEGAVVLWEVVSDFVQKSFLHVRGVRPVAAESAEHA
ncbi:cupin domain-containing protein [Streptomyces sp. ODS05-4]|uniref:cupin domain-containing protein n=1 Tax=Streptomyces sp. ODS05-4 TaxID=2944939 RepID=UPI00210F1469|nr:cupin domain-containing protein [Streptomyces sp. ODS05-4]